MNHNDRVCIFVDGGNFYHLALRKLNLTELDFNFDKLGKSEDKFLCYDNYNLDDNTFLYKSGYYDTKAIESFNHKKISEHIKYSYFVDYEGGKHPFDGVTEPEDEKSLAYSWAKAPRYDNKVVEVGPIARLLINKDPLINDLFDKFFGYATLWIL